MFLYNHFLDDEQSQTTVVDDIVRNVGFVLRTKRGCGSFLRSFGVSETGFKNGPHMAETLGREIRENIELYEPRLKVLDIDSDVDPESGHLALNVQCELRDGGGRLRIVYDPGDKAMRIVHEDQARESVG